MKACEQVKLPFDQYFAPTPFVSVKKDLSPEARAEIIKKIVTVFGPQWADLFDVKYPIEVRPQLLKDLHSDDKARALWALLGPESEMQLIAPYKPSIVKG